MASMQQYTALISKDGGMFVALCPELDVASQGATVEEARANLIEAVELFLETASPEEVRERQRSETYVSAIEIHVA
jgi:predicted RNase H-like HicB family nuclease